MAARNPRLGELKQRQNQGETLTQDELDEMARLEGEEAGQSSDKNDDDDRK